jgi:hypothetical protein
MAYDAWTLGGITVPHVREVNNNTKEGIITLSCSALNTNILTGDTDVRDEIARFQALTSQYVNNDSLLNGGSKLQPSGDIITVTDGTDTYTRCAVERVEIKENHKSVKRIDYDIIIHYQLTGKGASIVYTAPYNKAEYSSTVEYYYFYDPATGIKTSGESEGDLNGTEIGWMQITLPSGTNVKKVTIRGCGCELPATIYVNDVGQLWHYGEVPDTGGIATGIEPLEWDLATPTNVITIHTSIHTLADNHGAWPEYVKLDLE